MAVTDSEDVFVARMQVSETTSSIAANTSFLTDKSSKTASRMNSAPANAATSLLPETKPLSRLALSAERRPLAASASMSACTRPTPASTRS